MSRGRFLPVLGVVLVATLAHIWAIENYGWFRDELYYVACGRRLAWGYVDHPPLVAAVARLASWLGGSLIAHRLFAIVAGLGVLILAAALARRMGGGSLAMALSAWAAFAAPTYAFMFHYFSMNAFELLLGSGLVWVAWDAFERPANSRWVLLGLILGVGVLTKYGIAFYALAYVVAVLLSHQRCIFLTRGPWISAAVALLVVCPHLAWQWAHGFPSLEFMHNARTTKNVTFSPLGFLGAQVADMGPANAPLWAVGLVVLLRGRLRSGRSLRSWGVAFVLLFVVYVLTGGKPYYMMVAYPPLLAAGAVACERWLHRARTANVIGAGVAYGALSLVVLPMGLPILPVRALVPYARLFGSATPKQERSAVAELPQHYADMFGWTELVDAVAGVVVSLDEPERSKAVVLAANYGQASALAILGRGRGVPPVMSPHNAYFTWGPLPGAPVIAVGFGRERLVEIFGDVRDMARTRCRLCMPKENDLSIFACRDPRPGVERSWAELKTYR